MNTKGIRFGKYSTQAHTPKRREFFIGKIKCYVCIFIEKIQNYTIEYLINRIKTNHTLTHTTDFSINLKIKDNFYFCSPFL